METSDSQCENGHLMAVDDTFCGQCGAPMEANLPGTEPEWAATDPTAPEPPSACPQGHSNPVTNLYCSTCGEHIQPVSTSPSADRRDPLRVLLFIAGAAVLAITAFVVLNYASDDNDSSTEVVQSDDTAVEETTVTTSITDLCIEELGAWMPYVTGPGSIVDAYAEFGSSAPEAALITEANSAFLSSLYEVGRDEASEEGYAVIRQGCENLGEQYESGHLPPG